MSRDDFAEYADGYAARPTLRSRLRALVVEPLFDALRPRFARRQLDCCPSDPTTAVSWTYATRRRASGPRFFEIVLTGIWDVEARVWFYRWSFRAYGARPFTWLFSGLEDARDRYESRFDDDPMGRLSDYE